MENDSGRADVVGEVESFVYREEIEAGTGADDGSRGIGQGCGGLSDVRGVKNADDLRPRSPACPDAIRGGATTLHREYVVRARKAIQGYFGPDSAQYAQVGGTCQSDRKAGGRRAKVATVPEAA